MFFLAGLEAAYTLREYPRPLFSRPDQPHSATGFGRLPFSMCSCSRSLSVLSVEAMLCSLRRNVAGASRATDSQCTFGQIVILTLLSPLFAILRAMRTVV